MEPIRRLTEFLFLLLTAACVRGAFVEPVQPITDLLSYTDSQTRLPCQYKVGEGERVVQVTWYKELSDGREDPVIMAHFTEGNKDFPNYSSRVKFESFTPIEDNSALLIPVTQVSDEGLYRCHISTYPNGNFERSIKLTVWTLPIYSLDPVKMKDGEPFGVAASCRAVGRPLPRLSWDTDLPGRSQNRTIEGGTVSSHYSLHPLRSMNRKKLDCLVWHPGLEKPQRISNRLEVQYPPDPIIFSPTSDWCVGLTDAELVCDHRGYPKPQSVTWSRRGEPLPEGVFVAGEKLLFRRALQLKDSGIYECDVKNTVGAEKTEYLLTISGDCPENNKLVIIISATAGAVVLVLVVAVLLIRRRHQNKTRRLKMELQETKDEINSLSRQASFRRLNSSSSVSRIQHDDYALLRVDSRTKYSQMSLDRTHYKGSQSTLGGRWGPTGEVPRDEYGRPIVWNDDCESLRATEMDGEKEERRKRVESYVKNSNMSLDSGLPSSLVPLKAQQDENNGHKESDLGHLQEGDSAPGDDSVCESSTTEGHEDDESSSQQLARTLSRMFYSRNGVLRPIENPNAILLHSHKYPKGQII